MHTPLSKKMVSRVAPKKVLAENAKAIEYYDSYREASDLIERVDEVLGRKATYKSNTGSTLNFEINPNGICSTTSQKI